MKVRNLAGVPAAPHTQTTHGGGGVPSGAEAKPGTVVPQAGEELPAAVAWSC